METYWIEHALLLLIPFWLLKCSNMTVPASSWSDNIGWGTRYVICKKYLTKNFLAEEGELNTKSRAILKNVDSDLTEAKKGSKYL